MSQENFDTLLQFFKVLSNESRLKILGLLANEERSVGELAEILALREPTISHHLAVMKSMGLVSARAEGTTRIYQLNTTLLNSMNKDVFSQSNLATLVDAESQDVWGDRVLRTFIDGEEIKTLPSQYKKKLVILRWLAKKFEPGVRYSEKEVNAIITRHNPDYATMRRYMVDTGMMARERGIYWLTGAPTEKPLP